MFRPDIRQTPARSGFAMLELIFHAAVRNIRKSHGNAVIGLLMSIVPVSYTHLDVYKRQVRIGHHDHLKTAVVLLCQSHNATLQRLRPVTADDDHADGLTGHPIAAIIASITATSLGLFNSQNCRPLACTSTQSTCRPFSRKRNCSNPSSVSSGPMGQDGYAARAAWR